LNPSFQIEPPGEKPSARILAVDDNESIRTFYRHFFRLENLAVEIIGSPHEALEKFRAAPHDYSLLLTDCEMPGMNGEELARRVRQVRADLPMVMFSTAVTISGPQPFIAAGFQAALPKPVGIDKLRTTLRAAIGSASPATTAS
jgi:CheY-like chemotaxis protein